MANDHGSGRGPTALITGASSGIGAELARLAAADGNDVILVARNEAALTVLADELRAAHGVGTRVIATDLARPEASREIFEQLQRDAVAVDVLMNCAGFGGFGRFAEMDRDALLEMIQVNVTALTELTRVFLPAMIARGRGRILNVASTAAFAPGPLMATYYATKAYVLSLSEALANETAGTGVTVTTLCPGPTATAFQHRADMEDSRLFSGRNIMSARAVAVAGYTGMKQGRSLVIPGLQNKVIATAARLFPHAIVAAIARRSQERRSAAG